ncbi:hypothetical protein MPSEU_001055800 [Mayamaea pseudoterrestris]|nr:hypothetical protein MPSEU_001055800 [Mayamaea pseudoterrestris]
MRLQGLALIAASTLLGCHFSSASSSWSSWLSNDDAAQDSSEPSKVTKASSMDDNSQTLVSPLVNRQISAQVVARSWPTTVHNVYCEAMAYFASQSNEFLDALASIILQEEKLHEDEVQQETANKRALSAAASINPDTSLLEFHLAMRASSPKCELHRGLARQTFLQQSDLLAVQNETVMNAMAVLYPMEQVVIGMEGLQSLDWEKLTSSDMAINNTYTDLILPGERLQGSNETSAIFVVLYANLGTVDFARVYNLLTQQSANIKFVIRHLGAVTYEEDASLAKPTVLQGYGVRLDIRNVEYKVFDDRRTNAMGDEQASSSMVNVTDPTIKLPNEFLAGVNLTAPLLNRMLRGENGGDELTTRRQELASKLWQLHDERQLQSQIIPPVWQRRQLPLQMTTVIAASSDPLRTLEDVSQNLPSLASTLVHVKINETVLEMATKLHDASAIQAGKFYINGRAIRFDRPSFNVFELMDVMKEEHAALTDLQEQLGPYLTMEQLRAVQEAWIMGDEFMRSSKTSDEAATSAEANEAKDTTAGEKGYRVDVARGGKQAILYLNDVEKDRMFMQWPRSVKKMLMNMQYGYPPMVRRNLFTMLAVIDPIKSPENIGLEVAMQLMQSQFPIRIGSLFVSDEDIRACSQWLGLQVNVDDAAPCPTQDIVSGKPSLDALKSIKASTHAFHRIFHSFLKGNGKESGAALAYLEYFASQLREHSELRGHMSLYDLVVIHGNLIEGLGIKESADAQEAAMFGLSQTPSADDELSYGHALRFAAEKRLSAGMSFLNGRPLPLNRESDGLRKVVNDEQRYVFNLIATGEITDTGPKSVYGHLLSGDKVFGRFHPLLVDADENGGSFVKHDHLFAQASLLSPQSPSTPQPNVIIEGVFDFSVDGAFKQALALLDVLDAFESSNATPDDISIQFRFIPKMRHGASGALCSALLHASLLGTAKLRSIFSNASSGAAIDNLLDGSVVSDKIKKNLTSAACLSDGYQDPSLPPSFISVNGRIYALDPKTQPTRDDLELLLRLESARARAVSRLLEDASADGIARTASFLAYAESNIARVHVDKALSLTKLGDRWAADGNPLRMAWSIADGDTLKLHGCAVVDPATISAQRLSTILRLLHEHMRMDLIVVMRPELVIDGDSKIPVSSYYRFVVSADLVPKMSPGAHFHNLPTNHVLTLQIDVAEPWNVQQSFAVQDSDNLRCDVYSGCSDETYTGKDSMTIPLYEQKLITKVEYDLKSLLIFGQCFETSGSPPSGLQLTLSRQLSNRYATSSASKEVGLDGTIIDHRNLYGPSHHVHSDTIVMLNAGYWQMQAGPGLWDLAMASGTKGATIFDIIPGEYRRGRLITSSESGEDQKIKTIALQDFVNKGELLIVKRRPGYERESLFEDKEELSGDDNADVINVFSLATGHLYERFLKIMMLSVTKRTSAKVKFWLFENFLSPSFKESARHMAAAIGSEVEFVTYKWPEWLRGQSEKQRIIWGYKILFLDVLFPLNVKKIIYVDADQVLRGDLKELWDMNLEGKPYGYTPFCTSRETTLGYQFWREGFWKQHLRGKPYHISALYVVDLDRFRKTNVGDTLRAIYQQLSADPHSLSNLDQDLPNYAQNQVPIFSLPQEWLWCESWCSDDTKAASKTIDLCNNPLHKEPKVDMAKRVISGSLFNESWVELDAEVDSYEQAYKQASSLI